MSTQNTTKPMDAAKPDDVSAKPGARTSVSGAGRKPRPKVPRGTVKRLWGYISQYPVRLVIVVLSIIVSAAAQALSIAFLQRLVDTYIIPLVSATHPDWGPLIRALTMLAIMYAVGTFCAWLWGWLIIDIEQGTLKKIRDDMFAHQQRLPIRYFDTHEHGDVMSRYTNDTNTLRQAISQSFPQMFSSLLSALASLIAMMWLSVPFALFTLAFAIILFVFVNKLVARSGSQFVRQQRVLGDVNGFVEEAVNGRKVIKVFNHEDATQREFDRRNAELFDAAAKANTYGNITMPIVNNSGYLLYVATAILGAWAGLSGMHNFGFGGAGTMTLGTVIAMLTLSRGFINPLGQVSMQFTMVMMALAGASRIFALMDEPVEADGGTVTLVNVELGEDGRTMTETDRETQHWAWKRAADDDGTRSLAAAAKLRGQAREVAAKAKESAITSPDGRYTLLRGDVRFTDVTFGYDPSKPVLHDITWFAKPGQKVALVGATGAGKTTVTNLINRFYDIQEGQILYDGIDVRNIRKPDLRRSLGIVLQDVNLFTGTVMDNILYGRLDATDEECIEAAKRTNADGFIRMLPEGYHTVLSGDGSGLSQGQRQLISIARAAVADPPAMILDEATSSIDTRTEEVVQAGMDALMKGRTVFVIAHRLSTVRNADVIMVLDPGRIIERGNHDELIAQRGEYYQLYTGALELE